MCLMELPIPTSLTNRSHLTRFHMERMGFVTIEQLNGDLSQYTICIFRQTDLNQGTIRLTAGDVGPSTGCHTHSNT